MFLLRFLRYFPLLMTQSIGWQQLMYLSREGVDPRTPASVRWAAELKKTSIPPESENDRMLPVESNSIILKDLTMLKPDVMIYHTKDSEKAQGVLAKIKHDLFGMPCHEFYERWVVHPNFDFLITEDDRLDFSS
jgi:hypothetical protein